MSLPSLAPTADQPSLVQLNSVFKYSLYNDVEVWLAWQAAVEDPANNASEYEIAASEKFSYYLMKVVCDTTDDGDGCCMITGVYSPPFGGWCLFQSGGQLDTYRLENGVYGEMLEAFSSTQADCQAAVADKKLTVSASVLDYLDVFHCEVGSGGAFECYAY